MPCLGFKLRTAMTLEEIFPVAAGAAVVVGVGIVLVFEYGTSRVLWAIWLSVYFVVFIIGLMSGSYVFVQSVAWLTGSGLLAVASFLVLWGWLYYRG